jgi:hypothetical protein
MGGPKGSRGASALLRSRSSPAHCRFRSLQQTPLRGIFPLAPQAAARNPPLRLLSRVPGGAAAGGGRSEVKRSRAGASHGEPRTESLSEAAEAQSWRHRGSPISLGGTEEVAGERTRKSARRKGRGDHQNPYSFQRRVTSSTMFPSIRMSSGHSRANPSEAHLRVASIPIFDP